jgi:hypothetical protein
MKQQYHIIVGWRVNDQNEGQDIESGIKATNKLFLGRSRLSKIISSTEDIHQGF